MDHTEDITLCGLEPGPGFIEYKYWLCGETEIVMQRQN